jgi:Arc/MetJ-type ribon-helix-helix transcriptional regulator
MDLHALEVEFRVFKTDSKASFNAGSAKMAETSIKLDRVVEAVATLNAKKPMDWKGWGLFVITIGGLIFQAGTYPNRSEYGADRRAFEERIVMLNQEIRSLREEWIKLRGSVERLQDAQNAASIQQSRLEQKLDAALKKGR